MELKFVIFFLTTDKININNVILIVNQCYFQHLYVIESKSFFTELKKTRKTPLTSYKCTLLSLRCYLVILYYMCILHVYYAMIGP